MLINLQNEVKLETKNKHQMDLYVLCARLIVT